MSGCDCVDTDSNPNIDGVCETCDVTLTPGPEALKALTVCYEALTDLTNWERRRVLRALSVLCEVPDGR